MYLDFKDVCVTYEMPGRSVYAVDHVSLSLEKGQSLGLVGESGSGKSTLGMALLRLLPDTAKVTGSMMLDGQDMLTLSPKELHNVRWKKLSAVFQKSMNALSPVHRIGRQMVDIYLLHAPNASKAEAKARVIEVLKVVGLGERVFRAYPHELSGGMMQRTAIALSLLNNPEMILFDEATTALDRITQGQILMEVKRLEKEFNLTRIMITHDISVVASSCTHIAVLYAGRLMETGATADVLKQPMHPYTIGLLNAFPKLHGEKTRMTGISGSLPDLSQPIPGCVFAPPLSLCHGGVPQMCAAPDRRWQWAADRLSSSRRKGGEAMTAFLEVRDLKCHYPQHQQKINGHYPPVKAVDGVSFSLNAGEVLGIIGESGCGKSTLGRLLVQLDKPTGGEMLLDGQNAIDLCRKDAKAFRRTCQMVFQNPFDAFNPRFKLIKSMKRPLMVHGIGKDDAERTKLCVEILEAAGMRPALDYLDRFPHELSGGQLQRLSILRSMMLHPRLLVADEPVSMLDVSVRAEVMDLLEDLKARYHIEHGVYQS